MKIMSWAIYVCESDDTLELNERFLGLSFFTVNLFTSNPPTLAVVDHSIALGHTTINQEEDSIVD